MNHDNLFKAILRLSTLYFWVLGNDGCWFVSFILIMYLISPTVYILLSKDNDKNNIFVFLISFVILFLLLLNHLFPKYYLMVSIGLSRIPIYLVGMKMGLNINKQFDLRWMFLLCFASILEKIITVDEMSFICLILKSNRSLLIVAVTCVVIENLHWIDNVIFRMFGNITLEFYLIHLLILSFLKQFGTLTPIQLIAFFIISVMLSLFVKYVSGTVVKR